MAEWVALRVEVPDAAADAVANFLLEAGASGVVTEVREAGTAPPPAGRVRLEAGLAAGERTRVVAALERYLASLRTLDPTLAPARLEAMALAEIDWVAEARRHHRPLLVGRRLVVAPPWDAPASPGRELLVIEPGRAFGTGQHATTRGCLEAIEEVLEAGPVTSALDVGTGSGLLAVALARLGVPQVVALDVDPAVLPIARQNLARNRAGQVAVVGGGLPALRARFALVVANLLAEALVIEAPALAAAVMDGGRLVVSGLLEVQAAGVVAAYPGWRIAAARSLEGWQTLTLARDDG